MRGDNFADLIQEHVALLRATGVLVMRAHRVAEARIHLRQLLQLLHLLAELPLAPLRLLLRPIVLIRLLTGLLLE